MSPKNPLLFTQLSFLAGSDFLNTKAMRRILSGIFVLIVLFSILFHFIMLYEGQQQTWFTGLYWTLTVMSTLGFGDVTFTTDLGRAFSVLVLLTGVIFFLIVMPFAITQFICIPWMERQKRDLVPAGVPGGTSDHIIIAGTSPIAKSLASHLHTYGYRTIMLCSTLAEAIESIGQGQETCLGYHDDPETYRRLKADKAAMLVVLDTDVRSTNIIFSAREVAPTLNIVAGVEDATFRDVLRMAGGSRVFHFQSVLGDALARRVIRNTQRASVIGSFGELIVAEVRLLKTPLVGMTLRQSAIRARTGINIVAMLEQGVSRIPHLDSKFSNRTVLIVCGTRAQIDSLNRLVSSNDASPEAQPPVLILGCGGVGIAVAKTLEHLHVSTLLVDHDAAAVASACAAGMNAVLGEASDLIAMEKAGIRDTSAVVITTRNDDKNIFLTLYCRRLRPDVQILSRASVDRNVHGLHMAGADQVLSLSSLVSSTILNLLSKNRVLTLNERLSFFRYTAQKSLDGIPLRDSGIREKTGCSIAACSDATGVMHVNPEAGYVLKKGDRIYLIGSQQGMTQFINDYGIDKDVMQDGTRWTSASQQKPAGSRAS